MPFKKGTSVNTDRADAPPRSYRSAISIGLKSARIIPFDGEAFFTSAITETPGFFSAFLNDILFFQILQKIEVHGN